MISYHNRNVVRIGAVTLGAALAMWFIAARSGLLDEAPALSPITQDAACASAARYTERKLADDSFRDATIDGCEAMKISEQPDGTWVARGGATATQFGAPVTLTWTATVARFAGDPVPRVCAFGLAHAGNAFGPKSLDVGCR